MCRIKDCERYPFDRGLCLDHYRDALAPEKPKRKTRKKKVDAVEVLTTDATDVAEERTDEEK